MVKEDADLDHRQIEESPSNSVEEEPKVTNYFIFETFAKWVLGHIIGSFLSIYFVACIIPLFPPNPTFSFDNLPYFLIYFPFFLSTTTLWQACSFQEFLGVPWTETVFPVTLCLILLNYIPHIVELALNLFPIPFFYPTVACSIWLVPCNIVLFFIARNHPKVDRNTFRSKFKIWIIFVNIIGGYFLISSFYIFVFSISSKYVQLVTQVLYVGIVLLIKESAFRLSRQNNIFVYSVEFTSDIYILMAIPAAHSYVGQILRT